MLSTIIKGVREAEIRCRLAVLNRKELTLPFEAGYRIKSDIFEPTARMLLIVFL